MTDLTYLKENSPPKLLFSITIFKIENVHVLFLFLFSWLFFFHTVSTFNVTVNLSKMEKPLCSNIALSAHASHNLES